MTLTLNGSGTVSGISVGGLPDGTVHSADLHSSIVLGKILASGTATYSGSCNSASYIDAVTFTITPSAATSKIAIFANSLGVQEANTNFGGRVLRDGSTTVTEHSTFCNTGASRNIVPWTAMVLDAPNTTSEITYKIQFIKNNSGGVGTGVFGYNGKCVYFEVAA